MAEFVMDNGHVEIQEYVRNDESVVQEACLHMQAQLDARLSAETAPLESPEALPFKEVSRVNGRIEIREVEAAAEAIR